MENAGDRVGANKSPRRRKIWTGRLQIFGRFARRRREMHERAFGMVQGGSVARRQGLPHGFRQGKDDGQIDCHRRSQKQKDHWHTDHVSSGPDDFHHHDGVQIRASRNAVTRTGVSQSGFGNHAYG